MLVVTSQTPFTYLANVKPSTLCGVGENLVKAVFMSVYCRLTANSIQKNVKKGRCPKPGLLARIVDVEHDEYIVLCNFVDRIMSGF